MLEIKKQEKIIKEFIYYIFFITNNILFLIDGEVKDYITYFLFFMSTIIILLNIKNLKKDYLYQRKYYILIFLIIIFLTRNYFNFITTIIFLNILMSTIFLLKEKRGLKIYTVALATSFIIGILVYGFSPKFTDEIKEIYGFKFYRNLPLREGIAYLNYSSFNIFLVLCGSVLESFGVKIIILFFLLDSAKSSTILIYLLLIILQFLLLDKILIRIISNNSKKLIVLYFVIYILGVKILQNGHYTNIVDFFNGRIEIWSKTFEYFSSLNLLEKIIGSGWNCRVIEQYGELKHSHNEYLRVLIDFGIIGLLYFVYLINKTLKNLKTSKEFKILISIYFLAIFDANLIIGISTFSLYLLLYIATEKEVIQND